MSIGYACLIVGGLGTKLRTCREKNATYKVLSDLISSNLAALDTMLDYNIENEIKLFRISSDMIPFASHPVNTVKWWEEFSLELKELGKKALSNNIRLSMHPGQYTVLNSPNEEVVARAVKDLSYHARFMDSLGLGKDHKIILHIGGVYGDKTKAIQRFTSNYKTLDKNIKERLVIENDDKQYNINDVLTIGLAEEIPVIFDNLHHKINLDMTHTETEWISLCQATWKKVDGFQKIHYSQQGTDKRPGSHSPTIELEDFMQFYDKLMDKNIDIMLEVKDKNLSAIKCINAIATQKINRLEKEWARYKYLVLEHSPQAYKEIRQLLKDKSVYSVIDFYKLIDEAMNNPVTSGNAINAALHVWGYFKDSSDKKTRMSFEKMINKVSMGESAIPIKRLLWTLAKDQEEEYLLDSLYFMNMV